jgi:hypothetical protein
MWYQERKQKSKNTSNPKFQLCCAAGKVQLPQLEQPPQLLQNLLSQNQGTQSKNYQANARTYNAMFSFTSPGMNMDDQTMKGRGPPILRMQGQTCHRIGSMLPLKGQRPKFAQLYIYDTDNEIKNRIGTFRLCQLQHYSLLHPVHNSNNYLLLIYLSPNLKSNNILFS